MDYVLFTVLVQSVESLQIHSLYLRSVSNELLPVPVPNFKTFGDRYFAVWNSLPYSLGRLGLISKICALYKFNLLLLLYVPVLSMCTVHTAKQALAQI